MSIILTIPAALILYGTVIVSGYFLAIKMGIKKELERIGIGIFVATHLITYFSFLLYSYFGIRYTLPNLIFLLLVIFSLIVLPFYISLRKRKKKLSQVFSKIFKKIKSISLDNDELFLIFLIFIPIAFAYLQNIHWPVVDWDAVALYDYRAKVFVISGGMEDGISRGYFLHYPLYTSLLHTYTYLFKMQTSRVWYSLIYIATLSVFYGLLRRNVSRKRALVGTFLLSISPRIFQHAQMTYTNLPHAVYLALGYIYLWEWLKKGIKLDLLISGLLVAGSMWIRLTEPLWLPVIPIILIGLRRWKGQWKNALFVILMIFVLRQPWVDFIRHYDKLDVSNPLQIGEGLQLPSHPLEYLLRLKETTIFFINSIYPLFKQYIPSLTIAAVYALYKRKWEQILEYAIFFLLLMFIFGGIFLFSFQFGGWQDIPDSAARMSMFLIPLSVYLIMKSDLWSIPTKRKK